MRPADRRVYEKILFAQYLVEDSWDGQKFRQTLDRCLEWLITAEDVRTPAYLQYEYLRGRDPDFIGFVKEMLGVSDEAATREDLERRYGAKVAPWLSAAKARGAY
jgi:hypothetical protein